MDRLLKSKDKVARYLVPLAHGYTCDSGRLKEIVVVPEGTSVLSTKEALQHVGKSYHAQTGSGKAHATRENGELMWSFEECDNPICIRIRDLISQL